LLGQNFLFCAKVALEYFGSTWSILHRTSTKNHGGIKVNPRCGLRTVLARYAQPSHDGVLSEVYWKGQLGTSQNNLENFPLPSPDFFFGCQRASAKGIARNFLTVLL
jgi:hypothetical protein